MNNINDIAYYEDNEVVLSYEKAVELVFSQLHFAYGEMKKFCEQHDLQYNVISAIKNTYDDPLRETLYSPESIHKMLKSLNIETEIQKPKPQAVFVIKNPEQKKEILMKNKQEEIAAFESIDLVDFARHNGYRVNDQETLSFKEKSVGNITVMSSKSKDENIIIKEIPSGKFFFINPNNSLDKGNIVDFVMSRREVGEDTAIKWLREYFQDEGIVIDKVKDKITIKEIFGDNLEDFFKEQKELLKEYYGMKEELHDRTILHERGISDDTIDHYCFKGSVFNKDIIGEDGRKLFTNTIFPVYILQPNKALLVVGTEEITKEYRNAINVKRIDEAYSEVGLWMSKPFLGSFKKDENGKPALTFYIGESAIDCMAYAETHQANLADNYVFISTVGPHDGMSAKQRMLQNLVDWLNPDKMILINKNTLEGKRADIMLYAQTYQPSPIIEEDGFSMAMRSDEQTYSPKVIIDVKGQGKVEVKIEIPYKNAEERNTKRKFVRDTIAANFSIRDLGSVSMLEATQKHEILAFVTSVNEENLDKVINMVKTLQPEKQLFISIEKAVGLDYTQDLANKKSLEQKKKKEKEKDMSLGLDKI
ncbi:MAG: hypothetical protein MUC49_22375 [Raineya sp.]|jgi:hypothetical protein|nr:hypothetical protein [Raineya sp.]